MILGITFAIKILLPVAIMAGGYFLLRRRLSREKLACMGALVIIFALAANKAAGFVPPVRDEITLTALGEKREEAYLEEVYLTGYTIDGKAYLAGNDMKILDGKWFWTGETYCWRIETDTRQPEGVTRSITVGIPVGWNRTLDFEGSLWRGMVEISTGTDTWIADTYSADGSAVSVQIGESKTSLLVWDQIRCLAVYAVILLLLTAALSQRERFIRFNAKHPGVVIFLLIALCQLAIAIKYSSRDSLWFDEFCEIGWALEITDPLKHAFVDLVPRPISEFLLGIWIQIAPYGDKWLLLMPELLTATGIFFIGMCGKVYKNVRTGVFACTLAALSYELLGQCSYEIRSYSLLFMCSAVLLYLCILRYKSEIISRRKFMVAYTIVLVVFSQSHYYAYVFCVALFLLDVYAYRRLKIGHFSIIPYIVLGLCTIPSAVVVLKSGFISSYSSSNWQPIPTIRQVDDLLNYFASYSTFTRITFFAGALIVIGMAMFSRPGVTTDAEKNELLRRRFIDFIPISLMAFQILFMYVYGNINTKGTLWYNRYFTELCPCFYVICGFGIDEVCKYIGEIARNAKVTTLTIYVVILAQLSPAAVSTMESVHIPIYQPWREAADWIYTRSNDIYNDSTIIVGAAEPFIMNGWEKYYVERYGRRDPLNVYCYWGVPDETFLEYDTVYVVALHGYLAGSKKDLLDEYYDLLEDRSDIGVTVYGRKPSE